MGTEVRGALIGAGALHCWHRVHCRQYVSTSPAMFTQYASRRNRCSVLSTPWWPALGMSGYSAGPVGEVAMATLEP